MTSSGVARLAWPLPPVASICCSKESLARLTETSPVSWFTAISSDWATSEVDWLKSPLEERVATWLKAAKVSSAVKLPPSFRALSTGSTQARSEEHTSELKTL